MAGLEGRLRALEDRSREGAAAAVRGAWARLTDREIALILAPFHFGRPPTPEEVAAEASFRSGVPEALIYTAMGYTEGMPEEELSRRMGELVNPVLSRRRCGVLRELARAEVGG